MGQALAVRGRTAPPGPGEQLPPAPGEAPLAYWHQVQDDVGLLSVLGAYRGHGRGELLQGIGAEPERGQRLVVAQRQGELDPLHVAGC